MRKKSNQLIMIAMGGLIVLLVIIIVRQNQPAVAPASPAATLTQPADTMHDQPATTNAKTDSFQELLNTPAPDFSLTSLDGTEYSLASLKGKNILLFFNEGLMCYPACWNQIVSLAQDQTINDQAIVLSVVTDNPQDWQKAIEKMPELAKATVLFDQGGAVSRQFGMLTAPSSMHPGRFPGHSYLIIDREGTIRYTLDDPKMGIWNASLIAEISKLN
ncbi:redoxin domain-containing protein [Candidatus Falkowbacteria bacterium]|nr:redoxin domain-containing protein [Candidatus Falkowbacteria bacterium]